MPARLPAVLLLVLMALRVHADEQETYTEIRELAGQELDEALQRFEEALEEYPDSQQIKSLHMVFSSYLMRANRSLEAAAHAEAVVDLWLENVKKMPGRAASLPAIVQQVTHCYVAGGQPDTAREKMDEVIAKVESLQKELADPQVAGMLAQLQGRKAVLLSQLGKKDQARDYLAEVHDRVRTEFEANPESVAGVLALANVLAARTELAESVEDAEAARAEHHQFLAAQAKLHVDSPPLVSAYLNNELVSISRLSGSDAAQAEQRLVDLEGFIAGVESQDAAVRDVVSIAMRSVASLKSRIEAAKIQQALIGNPAFPLDAHAWVNGEPLTDEDLKGKVVLIDFWAVWCGPCIATFPHLIEWNDRYADRGLVIIGATRHYGYGWDAEAKGIQRVDDLAPEDEEAALVPFAEHHGLKHRFMVMPDDSEFSQKHGVTGIPTAVLIDRHGVIQMIRVGSGEENAHALEAKIEELLDAAPAGAGG